MPDPAIEPPSDSLAQPVGAVVVVACACQCHLPIGYIRAIDKPIPPVMRPCKDCASNEH